MNLPRRVVTLLLISVTLSAGSGISAVVALRNLAQRQDGVRLQMRKLKDMGQLKTLFTHLASLPARWRSHPEKAQEYESDLMNMGSLVRELIAKHRGSLDAALETEWMAYEENLSKVLTAFRERRPVPKKILNEVEEDGYLQMDLLILSVAINEERKTEELFSYIRTANRRIVTFLGLGLLLGLALAAEAYREASQIRAQNLLVKKMAGTDPLTGLANRRAFDDAFAKAWEEPGPLCVILFDIDHFKTYNDNHGHPEGDRLLKALAMTAREGIPQGALLARWGGEEFVLLLAAADATGATQVAETLRKLVEGLHEATAQPLARPVTISLGLAEDRNREGKALDLLEKADKALYKAKQGGRNRAVLSEE